MLQQTAQQAIRTREEKFVGTKEFFIATENAKDSKKSCHDRVDRLKRKMFITTRKIMSRQILDAEGNEKLVANKFDVATQDTYVATRTRLLNKIYVATLSKFVATESKNKPREHVAIEDCML